MANVATATVGDIFYSSGGYNQTNVYFYEVTRVTPKTLMFQRIGKRHDTAGKPRPNSNIKLGEPFRRRSSYYNGQVCASVCRYEFVLPYTGQDLYETPSGFGH